MAQVSVVIPTHNRATFLPKALDTVARQTLADLEIVVVDDASSDATQQLLAEFKERPLTVCRHDFCQGVAAARNTGVESAKAGSVAFLDDDDTWHPNKLELQLQFLKSQPEATVCFTEVLVERDGNRWVEPQRGPLVPECVAEYIFFSSGLILPSSLMLPTRLARESPFPPLSSHQDLGFFLELEDQGVGFSLLDQPLTYWNCEDDRSRLSLQGPDPTLKFLERYRDRLPGKAYDGLAVRYLVPKLAQCGRRLEALSFLLPAIKAARLPWKVLFAALVRALVPQALRTRAEALISYSKGPGRRALGGKVINDA